ncbi:hypothetical protein Ciccas_001321 [Cichlidogyrus casuarinus]|uniref:Tetraspanin n=1 Tax=Cichlidogyrus casuarinus TaxID=1844966 RepID=A0ABD2QKB9_9PLAT
MAVAKRSLKLILYLICVIFMFFGSALIALGIVTAVDSGDFTVVLNSALYSSSVYMIIFAGLVILLTSLCGYLGSEKENRGLLIIYIVILVLCVLFIFIAGIIALVSRDALTQATKSAMNNTLSQQYGRYRIVTATWDLIQSKLRCCAIEDRGWTSYIDSTWDFYVNADIHDKNAKISESNVFYKYVPVSCCWKLIDPLTGWPTETFLGVEQCQNFQFGPPNLPNGAHNTALYYGGCFNAIKMYLMRFALPLGILALISMLIMILAIVTAVVLLTRIRND